MLITLVSFAAATSSFHAAAQTCLADSTPFSVVCAVNNENYQINLADIEDDGCASPGDSVTVMLEWVIAPENAHDRYDLGLWVSRDGLSALTGECSVASLTAGDEGAENLDGDACYDRGVGDGVVSVTRMTVACTDNDADGQVDLLACMSWSSQDDRVCHDGVDTWPGSPSKCSCVDMNLPVSVAPEIDIEKLTNGQQADDPNGADVPVLRPGEPVSWTYLVTNIGTVPIPLSDLTVTDGVDGVVPERDITTDTGSDEVLAPGEQWTYRASGVALDLWNPSAQAPTVSGCANAEGPWAGSRAYQNTGTAEVPGHSDTDDSHYCVETPVLVFTDGFEDAVCPCDFSLLDQTPTTWTPTPNKLVTENLCLLTDGGSPVTDLSVFRSNQTCAVTLSGDGLQQELELNVRELNACAAALDRYAKKLNDVEGVTVTNVGTPCPTHE